MCIVRSCAYGISLPSRFFNQDWAYKTRLITRYAQWHNTTSPIIRRNRHTPMSRRVPRPTVLTLETVHRSPRAIDR